MSLNFLICLDRRSNIKTLAEGCVSYVPSKLNCQQSVFCHSSLQINYHVFDSSKSLLSHYRVGVMQRDRTQVECIVLVTSGFHHQSDRKRGLLCCK